MRRHTVLLITLALLLAAVSLAPRLSPTPADLYAIARVSAAGGAAQHLPAIYQAPSPTLTATPSPTSTFTPSPSPTVTPKPGALVWDPRLSQRGALLVPANVQPGEWYWRLVKGVWYAEHEPPFDGQHHIFVDTIDPPGIRRPGIRLLVTSLDGVTVLGDITTEAKPGDLYAANFPMYKAAPAYRVIPFTAPAGVLADGGPADAVTNLGLGTIEEPWRTSHTSYGFVWQWTQAPAPTATPWPTWPPATATPSATP